MSDLVRIIPPDAEVYAPREQVDDSSSLASLVRRVASLEAQMQDSNAWANRWAKEQVQLGLVIRDFRNNMLSKEEIDNIRTFIAEFQKLAGE